MWWRWPGKEPGADVSVGESRVEAEGIAGSSFPGRIAEGEVDAARGKPIISIPIYRAGYLIVRFCAGTVTLALALLACGGFTNLSQDRMVAWAIVRPAGDSHCSASS